MKPLKAQLLLELDGWTHGPLFAPVAKRRPPVRLPGKEGKVHRAQTRRATPSWADPRAIADFYCLAQALSQATGVEHVVDHMVPKISPWVCGLHVEHNLQVLDWLTNARKGNSWWPDMWAPQGELF